MEDISDMEVKNALFSMKPWTAPGPDGFPPSFYQKSWKIIGLDLIQFVKDVWQNPSIVAEFNKTDVCLIPKVGQPRCVAQFCSIPLCNTIYKTISKVVVSTLKPLMHLWCLRCRLVLFSADRSTKILL